MELPTAQSVRHAHQRKGCGCTGILLEAPSRNCPDSRNTSRWCRYCRPNINALVQNMSALSAYQGLGWEIALHVGRNANGRLAAVWDSRRDEGRVAWLLRIGVAAAKPISKELSQLAIQVGWMRHRGLVRAL